MHVLKFALNFIALFLLQCILSPPELLVDPSVQSLSFSLEHTCLLSLAVLLKPVYEDSLNSALAFVL